MVMLSALTMDRYIAILHPYSYCKIVTKKRVLLYVGSGAALIALVASLSVFVQRLIIQYFTGAIILPFFVLTVTAYRKIFKVIKNSSRYPHESKARDPERTKLLLKEIKQAKSCFIVVIGFVICLLPIALAVPFVLILDRFDADAIRIWVITCFVSNSLVNSMLFFWTKKLLRREARKVLKTLC